MPLESGSYRSGVKMSDFICDNCGKKVFPLDGIVSWNKENKTFTNFKLTHKNKPGVENGCQPEDNNRYRELYTLTLANGYLDFILYLIQNWENGYFLEGESLRKLIAQLNLHIHEKLLLMIED